MSVFTDMNQPLDLSAFLGANVRSAAMRRHENSSKKKCAGFSSVECRKRSRSYEPCASKILQHHVTIFISNLRQLSAAHDTVLACLPRV
jgi:hypothetical protein